MSSLSVFPCGDLEIPYKTWPETSRRSLEQTFHSLLQGQPGLEPLIRGLIDMNEQTRRLEFANYVAIEDWLNHCLPRAGGVPTVMVAASDATDHEKRLANAVCDGTDDQDTIANAVTSQIGSGRGRLVLSSGKFSLSGTIDFGSPSDFTIQGMGQDVTRIEATSGSSYDMLTGLGFTKLVMMDLTVDGNNTADDGVSNTLALGDAPSMFVRVKFYQVNDAAINDPGGSVFIHNCEFYDCGRGVNFDVDAHGSIVSSCVFDNCGKGIDVTQGFGHSMVVGCYFDNCTTVGVETGNDSTIIANNLIDGGCSDHAIGCGFVDDGDVVIGNIITSVSGSAIYARGGEHLISSNLIRGFGSLGIKLTTSGSAGSSDAQTVVIGNKVQDSTGTAVSVGSGLSDVVVVGNDLRGGATPISDSGTGTLVNWPAHATYGDNFT